MLEKSKFGELVPGFSVPVFNEREIRATAGIMFLATFIALMMIINGGNFVPIKYVITVFMIDFSVRLFINPKYAPLLILGRIIVQNQNPEYVGAPQKKFAWGIGFILSVLMFVLMVLLNTYSVITGITCLICLILMFFESAFGICIGCKLYGLIKKEKAQYCPGEVCEISNKQAIQKISKKQQLIFIGFILLIVILVFTINPYFVVKPTDLFQLLK